LIVNIDIV